jgi:ketosteroid isomerase-like protein
MVRTAVLAGLSWAAASVGALAHEPAKKAAEPHAAAHAAAPGSAEAAVDAFHAALERGDTAGALALMAEDVLVYEQGGAERSRAEYAAEHLAADAEFARATAGETRNRSARVARDLAVVTSETRTTGRFRDRDVNSAGVETMVLRRTPAGWRITHIHWSSRAAR